MTSSVSVSLEPWILMHTCPLGVHCNLPQCFWRCLPYSLLRRSIEQARLLVSILVWYSCIQAPACCIHVLCILDVHAHQRRCLNRQEVFIGLTLLKAGNWYGRPPWRPPGRIHYMSKSILGIDVIQQLTYPVWVGYQKWIISIFNTQSNSYRF